MRMGIIADRQKRRRARHMLKGVIGGLIVFAALAAAAFAPQIHLGMMRFGQDVQAFSQQMEMTLPGYDVYALQLAVFDNGERAAAQMQHLHSQGIRCVIVQGERMRLIADVALSRQALQSRAAKGHEAYVLRDTLQAIPLRLSADSMGIARAKRLLETPDALLHAIVKKPESSLRDIVNQAVRIADESLGTNTENMLYTQLAQSLNNWSVLMQKTLEEADETDARSYGAATMYLLCRQLRQALNASNTASAQRTPSTAADVIPPAYPAPSPQG